METGSFEFLAVFVNGDLARLTSSSAESCGHEVRICP